jgi:hypothetical protein
VPLDRDGARLRIAHEGLTDLAVERVARTALTRMPITLVDRARAQLRRFFSEGPWTVEDDAGLSAIVGPGEGWSIEDLAPGIRLGFGWRGGGFRVDVDAEPVQESAAPAEPEDAVVVATLPEHERTLGDTFEEHLVIEAGRNPAELRFQTGPSAGAPGRFTREEQGSSAAVAALFRDFEDIEEVRIEMGAVAITVRNPEAWDEILLQVFDLVNDSFIPPRSIPPDRQYLRALAEIGSLDVGNPRDLARILDATTSPDAAYRRVAVTMLEIADPIVVQKPWARALEDSSRAVRRATARAMAHIEGGADLRALFERALVDKDACVRYYGLRGLAQIGVGRADQTVERRKRDDDMRVRLAAIAAMEGRIPQ